MGNTILCLNPEQHMTGYSWRSSLHSTLMDGSSLVAMAFGRGSVAPFAFDPGLLTVVFVHRFSGTFAFVMVPSLSRGAPHGVGIGIRVCPDLHSALSPFAPETFLPHKVVSNPQASSDPKHSQSIPAP